MFAGLAGVFVVEGLQERMPAELRDIPDLVLALKDLQVKDGAIILAHDIRPTTVAAMPATLDALLGKGYKFVTVSELIAMEVPPQLAKKDAAAPAP